MKSIISSLLLSCLLIGTSILIPTHATAQTNESNPIGSWYHFGVFAPTATKVIDTGKMVYYLSGGFLFSYDIDAQESRSYTISNELTDVNITDIFYNPQRRFLAVAYQSGNIDLLFDDGAAYNVSDISVSPIDPPYTINHISFNGDDMYVSTAFGIVQFNTKRHEVVQSGIFRTPVTASCVLDDHLLIAVEKNVYALPLSERITVLDRFHKLNTGGNWSPVYEFYPIGNGVVLERLSNGSNYLTRHTYNLTDYNSTSTKSLAGNIQSGSYLMYAPDGNIYFKGSAGIYKVNDDYLGVTKLSPLSDEIKNDILSVNSLNSVWSLNTQGLARMSIASDGTPTTLMQRMLPEKFTVKEACLLKPSMDLKRLYVMNYGATNYKFHTSGDYLTLPQTSSCINLSDGDVLYGTPFPVPAAHPYTVNAQKNVGEYIISPSAIAENPNQTNSVVVSTTQDGVIKLVDNKFQGRYNSANAPIEYPYGWRIYGLDFDRGGNLWIYAGNASNRPQLQVLPAAKTLLDPAQVQESDWIAIDMGDWSTSKDADFLMCRHSNMIFITDAKGERMLFAYDTRGTFDDFSDDRYYIWEEFIDQDGHPWQPRLRSAFAEDNSGRVWVGTEEGVFEITSPAQAIDPSMRIRRIKVPKNDGTNTADYLLGTDRIYGIGVDAANRKWIGTQASGLFLVSPNGDEILDNFTPDNSPLKSMQINQVFADPTSSKIYIGTFDGLFTYVSDATPAMDDYSEIYAFPNPVRPDYRGDIHIKGLMEGSLVKIVDTGGNVVHSGRSEAGHYQWNGTNVNGVPVRTGVYYIYVSQNQSGSSKGAVTKLMIIR